MPDLTERRLEVQRAELAKQLTENPVWDDAWLALRTDIASQWVNNTGNTPLDVQSRERLHTKMLVLDEVRRSVEREVETGALAEKQLAGDK